MSGYLQIQKIDFKTQSTEPTDQELKNMKDKRQRLVLEV